MQRLTTPLLLVFLASCSGNRNSTSTFTGVMEATSIRVAAQTPGQITALPVTEGMAVKAGDTLAVVDKERLTYQEEQNRASIEEIERQIKAAMLQLDAAVINRDNLRTKYQRFAALAEADAATKQSVDDLKTQLDAAEAQIAASRTSIEALSSKRKQMDAVLKGITRQQRDAVITSPVAGVVLVRYAEYGELLGVGTPVCDIADMTDMWVRIYVPETRLPHVKLGHTASVKLDGMPDKSLSGKVSWISDKAEFTPKTILTEETRTALVFSVKVSVTNTEGLLKIGMPVTVTLQE